MRVLSPSLERCGGCGHISKQKMSSRLFWSVYMSVCMCMCVCRC